MKSNILLMAALGLSALAHGATPDGTFRKTGFSFGVLPSIAFDQDAGFQYGALTNLYWYGDGSNYPRYNHSLYLEASRCLSGATLLRANYDTRTLLPHARLRADVTWYDDVSLDFFGFNGYKAVYNADYADEDAADYRTRVFYNHQRKMFRAMVNYGTTFRRSPHVNWQAGIVAFNMQISRVHFGRLAKSAPDVPTLYDKYVGWGILRPREANGGFDAYVRAGIGYDSRDNESFPTRGIWTEALLAVAPSFFSSDANEYGKLTVYHRQYFDLHRGDLVLAYRLGWQQRLWGRTPFYLLPHWNTSVLTAATSQGLGGSKTLRGIKRHRVVADGSLMANIELRYIFARFGVAGQQVALGTNLFADMGLTTQEYGIDTSAVPDDERPLYFRTSADAPHWSSGLGLKVALNSNFVVSVDYGHAFDERDGTSGFYVLMNYLF